MENELSRVREQIPLVDMVSEMINTQSPRRAAARRSKPICRSCTRCRAKKVKCDGILPSCRACTSSSNHCTYPEDARKQGRLSKAEIEALQNELLLYRKLFEDRHSGSGNHQQQSQALEETRTEDPATHQENDVQNSLLNDSIASLQIPRNISQTPDQISSNEKFRSQLFRSTTLSLRNADEIVGDIPDGLSTAETHITCAIDENGSIEVHGVASHLHQPSAAKSHQEMMSEEEKLLQIQMAKDRLFAFAALQRQREMVMFSQLSQGLDIKIELDGLPVELATHLLELHWNRQHLAYLLTYRPAIFDSLVNDGPYANKLLLNAIYYSSCLYSDRSIFRSDPSDPLTMGDRFYNRFKELLIQEIDRPSLPTIVACLICGATLVSNGKQSAGWVLCGIAYRMVVDLGCHLSIPPQKDRKLAASRLTTMEMEMRTRIYWGAFVTDKFQSLYFGRQSALPPADARVTRTLLDEYEELENWTPYVDPLGCSNDSPNTNYRPRPTYAISTFQLHITLAQIAHAITATFYTIDSIRVDRGYLLQQKAKIQAELDKWFTNLPSHHRVDEGNDSLPPPPNQITPHTTYYTLNILLERPFLSTGHLSFLTDSASQSAGEVRCNEAALRIWHLVDIYKRAHTLRRAPYLISYATCSAIVVILNQTQSDASKYINCIAFFWSALLDLQRGCNSGMGKPLKILRALMNRLGQNIPNSDEREEYSRTQQGASFPRGQDAQDGNGTRDCVGPVSCDAVPSHDFVPAVENYVQGNMADDSNGSWDDQTWVDTMMYGQGLMDESLFGLFASDQPFMQGFDPIF